MVLPELIAPGACFLFELGHLNDLNGVVKGVLKSLIFVVQKATAPKTGVEFHQGSIGAISSSLATSCDVWRRRATSQLYCEKNLHTN